MIRDNTELAGGGVTGQIVLNSCKAEDYSVNVDGDGDSIFGASALRTIFRNGTGGGGKCIRVTED